MTTEDSAWIPVIFNMQMNDTGVSVYMANGDKHIGKFVNSEFEGIVIFKTHVSEQIVFLNHDHIVAIKVI